MYGTCFAVGDLFVAWKNTGDGVVVLEALERTVTLDNALRKLVSLMFSPLDSLKENRQFITLEDQEPLD